MAYSRTAEWWLSPFDDSRRNCDVHTWELCDRYGGVTRSAWSKRRQDAKAVLADKVPFAHLEKGAAAINAPTEPLSDPLTPEQYNELTTAEKVELDREVQRLKTRLAETEAKYSEAMRGGEVEDRICAHIEQRVPQLPKVKAPTFSKRNPGKPESVVALVSDYHVGEVVTREETGGLNAYDFDTFTRRWQYHVDSIGGICHGKLTGYDFPELVICGLGDMVSGIIHDELVETSDGTLMDWLIDGSWVFAQGIRQLAAEFPNVRVEWHFGNHGRVTQKPRYKRRWVNYDYLLGHMIATELRDIENITFTNHKSFWSLCEVQNHHLLNLHGDNIRGWGGIPLYGVNRAVANLSALLASQRKSFNVVNLGHFHQTALLERVDADVVLNGSAVGGNEYSYGALFTGSKPRQVIYGMHPERGRTWQYAIDLSHGDVHECRFDR